MKIRTIAVRENGTAEVFVPINNLVAPAEQYEQIQQVREKYPDATVKYEGNFLQVSFKSLAFARKALK